MSVSHNFIPFPNFHTPGKSNQIWPRPCHCRCSKSKANAAQGQTNPEVERGDGWAGAQMTPHLQSQHQAPWGQRAAHETPQQTPSGITCPQGCRRSPRPRGHMPPRSQCQWLHNGYKVGHPLRLKVQLDQQAKRHKTKARCTPSANTASQHKYAQLPQHHLGRIRQKEI